MKFPKQFELRKADNDGSYLIPFRGRDLFVIASDGGDWDHVSVSLENRCPNWEEMCYIKSLFFDEEEVVMQLHPAKSQYVNFCETCLHLWRPQKLEIPLPHHNLLFFDKA